MAVHGFRVDRSTRTIRVSKYLVQYTVLGSHRSLDECIPKLGFLGDLRVRTAAFVNIRLRLSVLRRPKHWFRKKKILYKISGIVYRKQIGTDDEDTEKFIV